MWSMQTTGWKEQLEKEKKMKTREQGKTTYGSFSILTGVGISVTLC